MGLGWGARVRVYARDEKEKKNKEKGEMKPEDVGGMGWVNPAC